jgi:flagellar biosynthesis/type III secretory pathway M-ring protein FliF/YscJ
MEVPMTAEAFRAIIVALASFWTFILILLLVMMFILYRRMSAMRATIEKAVAETKEAAKPIMQIAAIIDVVKSGIDLIGGISKVRKGGE